VTPLSFGEPRNSMKQPSLFTVFLSLVAWVTI